MWTTKQLLLAITATLILLAGSAWYGYSKGRQSGMAQTQARWDSEKLTSQEAARKAQATLQAKADNYRSKLHEANKRIDDLEQRDLYGLLSRPDVRASSTADLTTPGVGATGAELAKPDAGFLARYAADAARLQAAYDECRTKYGDASELAR